MLKQWIVNFIADIVPDGGCPFERHVEWRGITIIHIPPLCKLNIWYHDVVTEKLKRKGYE